MKSLFSILAFTLVTLCAYSCWAFGGGRFGSAVALYSACAAVFILIGPLAIYPQVRSICSRKRFYIFFILGFIAYAVSWSVLWFRFHDKFGEIFGSLIGLTAMAALFKIGIGRPRQIVTGAALLFFFHTAGYHLGERLYQNLGPTHASLARLAWGLAHGLGFGTGIVLALRGSTSSGGDKA